MKGAPKRVSSSSLQEEGTATSELTHNLSYQPLSNRPGVLIPHQTNLVRLHVPVRPATTRHAALPCYAYPVSECEAEDGC